MRAIPTDGHQASAHVSWNWCTYICFYVDSEVAAPSDASLLLDEETPENQPGTSAVTTRVIPNNRRCKKKKKKTTHGACRVRYWS